MQYANILYMCLQFVGSKAEHSLAQQFILCVRYEYKNHDKGGQSMHD